MATKPTGKHTRHQYNLPLDERLKKVEGARNEGYIIIETEMTTLKFRQIVSAIEHRIEELEDFANDAFDSAIADEREDEKAGKKHNRHLKQLKQAKETLWAGTTWSGNPAKSKTNRKERDRLAKRLAEK
jgi:predicted DNA-binding protein